MPATINGQHMGQLLTEMDAWSERNRQNNLYDHKEARQPCFHFLHARRPFHDEKHKHCEHTHTASSAGFLSLSRPNFDLYLHPE